MISTHRDSWQNSVSEIERVSDTNQDELRVVEVGPFEEGVQHLLTLALQLVNLIKDQQNVFLGRDNLLLQKLLSLDIVADEMVLAGGKDQLGNLGEDLGRGSERNAVDEGTSQLVAGILGQVRQEVLQAGRLARARGAADVQTLLGVGLLRLFKLLLLLLALLASGALLGRGLGWPRADVAFEKIFHLLELQRSADQGVGQGRRQSLAGQCEPAHVRPEQRLLGRRFQLQIFGNLFRRNRFGIVEAELLLWSGRQADGLDNGLSG